MPLTAKQAIRHLTPSLAANEKPAIIPGFLPLMRTRRLQATAAQPPGERRCCGVV